MKPEQSLNHQDLSTIQHLLLEQEAQQHSNDLCDIWYKLQVLKAELEGAP